VAYQRSAYLVVASQGGSTVRLAGDPSDKGVFVPANAIIRFSDTSLMPFIETGSVGAAYRLYRAAFARTPDMAGLLYWIDVLNTGVSLESIAGGFVNSVEFKLNYGDNLKDPELITRLYRNVLNREPDKSGLSFWQSAQQSGIPVSQILEAFSESAENKSATLAQIGSGVAFKEPGVSYSGTMAPGTAVTLTMNGTRTVGSTLVIKPDLGTVVSAQAAYVWSLMSKPAASMVQLNSSASQLSFIPDVPGTYHVGLVITDSGKAFTGAAQVTVTEQRLLNQPYLAKNGMTVTLEQMTITPRGSNYVDYTVTYVQANKTDQAIDEGTLKLYFEKTTAMPQYGGFNKVYPGESLRRSYTFTQLTTEAPTVLEYDKDNFFRPMPANDSLRWPVPLN
jgi:hypothetical protein